MYTSRYMDKEKSISHTAYEATTSTSSVQQVEPSRSMKTLALIAVCLGYFMVILDTTIVNVALFNIKHQLGASVTELQWIVDGYALVFASLLLTAGALGDRLGSKRVFMVGLVIFSVASALCGASPVLWVLQIARVVQGVGAALLVPTSLSLLSQAFPDQKERARAIGIWGSIGGIGAVTGPILGGFLVNFLSWRSVFLVNVPVGLLGLLLTMRAVTSSARLQRRGLDPGAQVAGGVALGMITFVFIEGNALGWNSRPILGAMGIFVLAALVFLIVENRTQDPMLPLSLFGIPTFSAANTVGFLLNFGFYGQLFFISLFFQQVRGYSALLTGLALLPESGMVFLGSTLSGWVTGRTGPRVPMFLGLLVGSAGFLSMILVDKETAYPVMCGMLMAIGFGTSFTMPAMTSAVIASAPQERSGIASAVLNASRQVGGVLGVALLGSLVSVQNIFIQGMHTALLCAAGAFLLGSMLSLLFVRPAS